MLIRSFSIFIALLIIISLTDSFAQTDPDPNRFQDQVDEILEKYAGHENQENLVLFTGSSSIRGWNELENTFPEYNILNTGFGGSHASDLLYYIEDLILKFSPEKIFIYEGDNDISSGKDAERIMETMALIVSEIHDRLPECKIIIISAKPSISRWQFQEEYMQLNNLFETFSVNHEHVFYANIWDIMLGENGEPLQHIFLDDNLHMNQFGYDLWAEIIKEYLD